MLMSKSKILLVGSDGYIGSNCPFECSKMDVKFGQDFFYQNPLPFNTIIFLAARVDNFSKTDFEYNEKLYSKLDEWLEQYPDIHVIYSSSAAVYGEGNVIHQEYEYPKPINLYGESKLSGEFHVREYKHHTVLRLGNVYGKLNGQSGHGVTEAFQSGQTTIFGDGTQIRDFVPISKVWQVIGLAAGCPEVWQGVFNVSLSRPVTINEWFSRNGQGDAEYVDSKEGEIYTSMLSNSKMEDGLAACGQ